MQSNVRFSDAYCRYNEQLPSFLHNRPREFVVHVCSRWSSAQTFTADCITEVDGRNFLVHSPDFGATYRVCFGRKADEMPNCNCVDWSQYHWPCKHFCAVFLLISHGWNELAACYRDSAYFTVDTDVVSMRLPPPRHSRQQH